VTIPSVIGVSPSSVLAELPLSIPKPSSVPPSGDDGPCPQSRSLGWHADAAGCSIKRPRQQKTCDCNGASVDACSARQSEARSPLRLWRAAQHKRPRY
jgi:hypothetical protein